MDAITWTITYTMVTPNGAVLRQYGSAEAVAASEAIDAYLARLGGPAGIITIGAYAERSGRGAAQRTVGVRQWTGRRWEAVPAEG